MLNRPGIAAAILQLSGPENTAPWKRELTRIGPGDPVPCCRSNHRDVRESPAPAQASWRIECYGPAGLNEASRQGPASIRYAFGDIDPASTWPENVQSP